VTARDDQRIARRGARVLVVDRDAHVLLLRGVDPARPADAPWWFTPGGGVDPGETDAEAARRELREETGFRAGDLGEPVWRRVVDFDFIGRRYRQSEVFFLLEVDRFAVDTAGHSAIERAAVVGHRWWALAELAETSDTVYPSTLAAGVAALLAQGRPAVPLEVAP
jgi:8-oxo-dGTP pyrophosphatase MutT (NUDIX family)